jgi:putative membrane protein
MDFAELLKGVPVFLVYLGVGFGLLVAFVTVYTLITPLDEFRHIRSGNVAACLSLGGAVIGFLLPLAIVMAHHGKIANVAMWGVIALIVQLFAFFIAWAIMPGLPRSIGEGKVSAGAFAGIVALAIGILNAAAQTE